MRSVSEIWKSRHIHLLFLAYFLVAVIASVQGLIHGPKQFTPGGPFYHEYNNYAIFKQSSFHLSEGKNLYQPYPEEYWDLYKYSPSFALFFSVFSFLPDWLGLTLWCLLNSLMLFAAINRLPGIVDEKRSWILLFCLIELLGSLQNAQSNALMAALIILAFAFLEDANYIMATFCIVFSCYIKIFGAVGFALFLMYPGKRKMIAYGIIWFLVLGLLPALLTGFNGLIQSYKEWFRLLGEDREGSQGLSLSGILESWFHIEMPRSLITLAGILVFCIPLTRVKMYRFLEFRVLMLASVLLWIIAFNHKAESPTFIISVAGMAIWYFLKERNRRDTILLWMGFILTTLSVSDLCPRPIREHIVIPFGIKGIMTVVIWIKVIQELIKMNYWKQLDYGMNTGEYPWTNR